MPSYCTLKFEETGEIEAVPAVWLSDGNTRCRWPLYKNTNKIIRAAVESAQPAANWTTHNVTVYRIYDCYEAAQADAMIGTANLHSNENTGTGGWESITKEEVGARSDDEMLFLSTDPTSLPLPPAMDLGAPPSIQLQFKPEPGAKIEHSELISDVMNVNKSVVHALARCESRLDDQTKVLDQLCGLVQDLSLQLRMIRSTSPDLDFSTVNDLLPIMSLEEFEAFESRLSSDEEFKNTLKRRLTSLGGHDVRSAVKSCLDTLLHNRLQLKFNWEGRTSWKTKNNEIKKPFRPTNSCRIMISVLTVKGHLQTDEREVGRAIMVYLRNAPDRCGGRTRRSHPAGGPEQGSSV